MSEQPTVTERQAVERERAAWVEGAICWAGGAVSGPGILSELAAQTYPMPKITRPRVVVDEFGVEWTVVDGEVVPNVYGAGGGSSAADYNTTTKRILLWADLLNNPTEEVEE